MNILLPIVRRVRHPFTEQPATNVLEAGAVCPHCGRASVPAIAPVQAEAATVTAAETAPPIAPVAEPVMKPAKKKSRVETPEN